MSWAVGVRTSGQSATADAEGARHGYPPPVKPIGSTVVAYCGVLMVVAGESLSRPPGDTCPECVEIWRRRSRKRRFGRRPGP